PKALSAQMEVVQKSVLTMVGHYLGPRTSVRANLFTPDSSQPTVLTAARWGFHGGTTPSDRTLGPVIPHMTWLWTSLNVSWRTPTDFQNSNYREIDRIVHSRLTR